MKLASNPRYDALVEILRRHRKFLQPWHGEAFRSAALPYACADKLIDGKGAYQHGSRWSAPRAFRCVNLSTAVDTAWQESHALAAYYGLKEAVLQPRVLVGVHLKLQRVLDLVGNVSLARETGLAEVLAEDWHRVNDGGSESLGQAFGRAAHHLGAEAIMAPSARVKDGRNIVVFPESLRARSQMKVIGENELDRWLKKK